ncbi:MAG: zinc ABC transporter solute-binding protein, partial [Gammaproteobacteria bacterium]|nr:zinc ABC transporter solute-binding protein [Gammaproteobacteria bacterium]
MIWFFARHFRWILHGNMWFLNSLNCLNYLPSQPDSIMPNTIKAYFSLMRAIITCLMLLIFSTAANASTQSAGSGAIVVTIKPLFSLVAHLTEGIHVPALLMKQAQSPHHYNMRPSERRLLANASMIVWVGPQMETYLSKVIQQQSSIEVQAIQAKG